MMNVEGKADTNGVASSKTVVEGNLSAFNRLSLG
jgi:hypothetical protein